MFHHLLHLPFVILHFAAVALMIVGAVVLFRPFAAGRCGHHRARPLPDSEPENRAFEDYRRATLTRLEKEADEFRSYLEKLRRAADASAFQAFLQSRRDGGSSAS